MRMTLQELRESLGYSLEELAEFLRVSRMAIYIWEEGKATPSSKNLKKLSVFFNKSMDEMLNIVQETQKNMKGRGE